MGVLCEMQPFASMLFGWAVVHLAYMALKYLELTQRMLSHAVVPASWDIVASITAALYCLARCVFYGLWLNDYWGDDAAAATLFTQGAGPAAATARTATLSWRLMTQLPPVLLPLIVMMYFKRWFNPEREGHGGEEEALRRCESTEARIRNSLQTSELIVLAALANNCLLTGLYIFTPTSMSAGLVRLMQTACSLLVLLTQGKAFVLDFLRHDQAHDGGVTALATLLGVGLALTVAALHLFLHLSVVSLLLVAAVGVVLILFLIAADFSDTPVRNRRQAGLVQLLCITMIVVDAAVHAYADGRKMRTVLGGLYLATMRVGECALVHVVYADLFAMELEREDLVRGTSNHED